MSDLRVTALELAIRFYGGSSANAETTPEPEVVISTATAFHAFLDTFSSPAAPAKTRKTKDAAPADAVVDTTAAKEQEKVVATVAKEEPKADPKPAATGGATAEEVKALVGKVAVNAAAGGGPAARAILNECGGATNLTTLKPEFYAKAKAALEALLKTAAEAAELEG